MTSKVSKLEETDDFNENYPRFANADRWICWSSLNLTPR